MKNRTLQIDVLKIEGHIVTCKIIIDGRGCIFHTSKSNYEALVYDGVFIRDGKEKDSANVINTTNVFEERI